jgi:hypothetical protein
MDGHPLPGAAILITGGVGFRSVIHSNSRGEFILTLPYGQYRLSGDPPNRTANSDATVFVAPLQTTRLDLVIGASGAIRDMQLAARTPGIWTDAPSGRLYPEAFSLAGLLLSREPSSVTEPLDFAGLSDNRLTVASQRGFSWTDTQYKFQGMDATDSWQPGIPAVLPDVEALGEVVVRSAFAQTTSSSNCRARCFFFYACVVAWCAFVGEHWCRACLDQSACSGGQGIGAAGRPVSLVHTRSFGDRRATH